MSKHLPRVLLLADIPGWAYDFTARSLAYHLADRFVVDIAYASDGARLDPKRYDLLYVFYWADRTPTEFGFKASQIIREVASYRWATSAWYGRLTPEQFVHRFLGDCAIVTTPARFLEELISPYHPDVFLLPKGFEPGLFSDRESREGPLRIGWVGNPDDDSKGLRDILMPATDGRFHFSHSPGTWNRSRGAWSRARVGAFYNTIDVIAVASRSEGQPLSLIEGMASGCFPVAVRTGIVPEVVRSGFNGLIVQRSVPAFREAFEWCESNLSLVRRAGEFNSRLMQESRTWSDRAQRFAKIFDYALARAAGDTESRPKPSEPPPPLLLALHESTSATALLNETFDCAEAPPSRRPSAMNSLRWRASDARIRTRTWWREFPERLRHLGTKFVPEQLRRALRRDRR